MKTKKNISIDNLKDLTFEKIDENNLEQILNLKVKKNQIDFCESIQSSLEAARIYPQYYPFGIKLKEAFVGFIMIGFFEREGANGRIWIDRFLIDQQFQHLGLGKRALQRIIEILFHDYAFDEIFLSVYSNNESAIHLYQKIGFRFNGEKDENGEDVMVLMKYDFKG